MKTKLKIKIKSLAAEAKIIRLEEKKALKQADRLKGDASKAFGRLHESLYLHRILIVRNACRHSHLVYGLLKNKPYSCMETKCNEPPNWDKVRKEAQKFGAKEDQIKIWLEEAQAYCKPMSW